MHSRRVFPTMRVWAIVCMSVTLPVEVHSQESISAAEKFTILADFADRVCSEQDRLVVSLEDPNQQVAVSGEIEAKVRGLLSSFADLGVKGEGSLSSASFANLLEGDLKEVLLAGSQCRERTIEKMEGRLFDDISEVDPTSAFAENVDRFNDLCGSFVDHEGAYHSNEINFDCNGLSCAFDGLTNSGKNEAYNFEVEEIKSLRLLTHKSSDAVRFEVFFVCRMGACISSSIGKNLATFGLTLYDEECARHLANSFAAVN